MCFTRIFNKIASKFKMISFYFIFGRERCMNIRCLGHGTIVSIEKAYAEIGNRRDYLNIYRELKSRYHFTNYYYESITGSGKEKSVRVMNGRGMIDVYERIIEMINPREIWIVNTDEGKKLLIRVVKYGERVLYSILEIIDVE